MAWRIEIVVIEVRNELTTRSMDADVPLHSDG